MAHLQVVHTAASLTASAVARKNLMVQFAVAAWVKPKTPIFAQGLPHEARLSGKREGLRVAHLAETGNNATANSAGH